MNPAPVSAGVPLVRARSPDETFAMVDGRAVTVRQFLAHVEATAARLPARAHVFNVCADRYRFTVGFAAALCRGQVSLLPPTRAPDFLARLARERSDTYCLTDEPDVAMPFDIVPLGPLPLSGEARGAVPSLAADQLAAISFTSGSTGDPTPHRKRWGALARGAEGEAASLGLDRLALQRPQPPTLVGTVPPQHMYGFESTVLLALHGGCILAAERPFYPADIRAALERARAPRVLVTTPVHLRALLLDRIRLPQLALIVCATAPLSPALATEAEARFVAPVREIYGFTEAGMVAARRTVEGPEWTLLPDVRIRHDGERWWAEGGHVPIPAPFADIIEVGADGRFVLAGRGSDVVNVAGKRASLATLNHHLVSVSGVLDGAYYLPEDGGPAARLGAFVVAPGLDAQAILTALRARMDAAFLPRPLHFVASLPRNETGKLTLEALRALARDCARR